VAAGDGGLNTDGKEERFVLRLLGSGVCNRTLNFYSLEEEMALGRQLAAQFQRDTTPLVSPAALAYINGIGQHLVAQFGASPFTYTFALVADDPTVMHEVAAFPGGFLFVPASLILAAKDGV
jgi:predicted Zn-dependent protease